VKILAFHCEWLRNGDLPNAQNKEVRKSKDFPTLHSHFSNYDYGSTNYKNISFICTICENFSFPSSTVWKW